MPLRPVANRLRPPRCVAIAFASATLALVFWSLGSLAFGAPEFGAVQRTEASGCTANKSYGYGDGPTSADYRGSQGVLTIPTSYNIPNESNAFHADSVWIMLSTDPSTASTEGGISYGYANGPGTFQSYWYYYQTIHDGLSEYDDNQPLTPGQAYRLSVYYVTAGTTTLYFQGQPAKVNAR